MENGNRIEKIATELESTNEMIEKSKQQAKQQTQKDLLLSLVISNFEIADEYITNLIKVHGYEEAFKITQQSRICEFTLYRNSK